MSFKEEGLYKSRGQDHLDINAGIITDALNIHPFIHSFIHQTSWIPPIKCQLLGIQNIISSVAYEGPHSLLYLKYKEQENNYPSKLSPKELCYVELKESWEQFLRNVTQR